MDGLDLKNIGFKYVDIPDPTSGEGGGGTATGAVFFDKTTGKEIPDYLGNNLFLVVDRATQKPKIQQGWQNEGLAGIYHGFKEIAKSPAGQMLLAAATAGTNLGATIGSTLAPAANASIQAALGGAAIGAGNAAITGGDILKGAVLGGGLAYGGSELRAALNSGVTDAATLKAAADADMYAGMLPEYGTNAAYDKAITDLMANSPGAVEQLQNVVDSQVGGKLGPDNIDVGGGQNFAMQGPATGTTAPNMDNLPQADYSNEGRNYPTAESTQGTGGSPVNASTATEAGLPGLKVSDSGLSLKDLSPFAKLALAAAGAGGLKALADQKSGTITTGGSEATGPLAGYTFDPSAFRASTPDPMWFRPGSEIETVASQAKRGYAQGGSTKPTLTPKAKLASMDPWSRALAEMNNAAYGARMPRAMTMPQAGIAQLGQFAQGGGVYDLGSYSDGGRLLRGPGDGVSDSIPATIGQGQQPARLADGEFVIPARIVSELGNGSTDAGARKLYAMMDRVQRARGKTTGKGKVAADTNADKHLPA